MPKVSGWYEDGQRGGWRASTPPGGSDATVPAALGLSRTIVNHLTASVDLKLTREDGSRMVIALPMVVAQELAQWITRAGEADDQARQVAAQLSSVTCLNCGERRCACSPAERAASFAAATRRTARYTTTDFPKLDGEGVSP